MTTVSKKSGSTRMRPKARLISLLGEELISDERVAVVELVKNAFDADATVVNVKFENNDLGEPIKLIIEDNGHGMELDTVLGAWFEPGTDLKKKTDRSPSKKRLFQGAKGVGRFAAARLGTNLFLETKTKNHPGVLVALSWGKFDEQSYLDEVELLYETTDRLEFSFGTRLTIEEVSSKKEWQDVDYFNLHNRLSRLMSPFNEIDDFEIILEIPNYPELTGKVEPHPLSQKPTYIFNGNLSKNGNISGNLFIDKKIIKKYQNQRIAKKGKSVDCGAFDFEIRAWDRDRLGLAPYMLEFNMNISTVRKTLDTYCGVSIYRDGFRVHPYGEQGNDWLSLDIRSRQNPTKHFGNNQIISSVKISRETNSELKDRTTREGLVHTPEFEELKDWFTRILSLLEEERYKRRPREDAQPEYKTTLFEAFDMNEVVVEANKQLGKDHAVSLLVKNKNTEVREGVKKLQEHYSRVLLAAGLGQMVDLVIHEIGAPLGRVNREITYLRKVIDRYELDEKDQQNIQKSFNSIQGWLEQIANLRGRLDPKTAGKRGRATTFSVADEILGNLNLYENLLGKQKIKVKFKNPKDPVIVKMAQSNLGQIVANLIDNSIHWLTHHRGDGKGGTIDIELHATKNGFKILFSDNGPGIAEEERGRVFEQYFTKKPNGMGLGLFIARQVIEPYGSLQLLKESKLAGVTFEADFTRKVGL